MKKFILLSLLFIGLISLLSFKKKDGDPVGDNIRPNPYPLVVTSVLLDANTISTWFRTNGSFNYDPSNINNPGFEWPKGQGTFARFASGLWLGAKVANDTLIAVAYYAFEYLPGYTDNNGIPREKDDPNYRMYKITKGINSPDRTAWPNALLGNSDQGAPVFYDSASASWKPYDYGTQTIYGVFTDSYQESHSVEGGSTLPLKADVKMTNFAFDRNGPLGQIAFTQWVITNRSANVWNDVYLSAWTDDDLGFANDDKVSVTVPLGLGITYNNTNNDPSYGVAPPAVGFDFFRGALLHTNQNTDTAFVCDGTRKDTLVGYKDLGMTVFNWFENTGDPVNGNPRSFRETYRFISGFRRNGIPIISPVNGDTSKFMFDGDPVTNSGWVQPIQNDQRFMQSTGPFSMAPNETQTIVLAQIIARGNSNLNSITQLRDYDVLAQKIYDNCFNVATCAPPPTTSYYAPGNGKVYLSWDEKDERISIPNKLSTGTYLFQGYNVYQIRAGTDGSKPADRKLLATFDIRDGITDIKDTITDEYGVTVYVVVQKGYDNGISRFIVIDKDNFNNTLFINGTPYYFSVTAYHQDSLAGPFNASPRVCESSVSGGVIRVIPQHLTQGTQVFYNVGDTISTNRRDLAVVPVVIDPLVLITANYSSAFANVNNQLVWSLTRNGSPIIENSADFSGSQDTAVMVDGFFPLHQVVKDSGVVKDVDLGAVLGRDIYTKEGGWSYSPPENRWLQGPDTGKIATAQLFTNRQFQSRQMGISFPQGTPNPTFRGAATRIKANGPYLYPVNGILNGGPLRKVRIVFGNTQLAYRYVSPNGNVLLTDTNISNTPYVDMVAVPFQAFAVDDLDSSGGTPRQLNLAFVDTDANGVWDPDTSKLGKYQIMYFFASSYDPTPNSVYTSRNVGFASNFQALDIMYAWVPRVIKTGPGTYNNGDVLEFYPYIPTRAEFVPGYQIHYDWSVQGSIIGSNSLASQNNQMEKVKVFPNPYYGQSRLENDPVNRFIYFSNLPKECTIYIYTLNGVLIRKIVRSTTDPRNSLEQWDLRNSSDIPIASGMYIALVDAPGIGTKVLKLAIFTPEERIDIF